MAKELQKDEAWIEKEIKSYSTLVANYTL